MRSPIAITGIGVVSPAGTTPEALWQSLAAQDDLRSNWPKRPLTQYPVDNVVPIPEDLWKTVSTHGGRHPYRAKNLAEFAVAQALAEARLPVSGSLRLGCILASTTAGVEAVEDDVLSLRSDGRAAAPSDLDAATIVPSRVRRWTGPTSVISTACSSGLIAPALAMDALLAGEADAMVAGGLDVLLEYTICGFNGLRLATGDRCRPFSTGRKGVVLSEGATCFCLEPLHSALKRGAGIRAVVTGYGISCDADHLTAPNTAGVARAITQALDMAGLTPDAIGGVFAHGTGTPTNDASEVAALRVAFGDVALPPITSIKSVMGHPQAGAGAFSLLSAVLALENSQMPPTAGLEEVDPALDGAEIVHSAGTALTKRNLMVNAFGFGGNNCVMIVSDPAALGLSMEAA